ncbi:hypothetical protein KKC63_00560 [Patescibacteria group bacterium]|nr:hypothetical protein [Patescibacteria group bacterium]MBU4022802.1 hypothetical protein [Patescibacteria group bacterium]
MINNKLSKKGFTLMEMLIVSGMFSILIIVIASIFVSAIRIENKVFATKKVLSQVSYSVEYMTRAIRMAEKDTVGDCISRGDNYEISGVNDDNITFKNALQDGNCQIFYLNNGQIKIQDFVTGTDFDLTSSDVEISNLSFTANGEQQGDIFQPFITIYLEAQSSDSPILEIQTSVSQRNPDITR